MYYMHGAFGTKKRLNVSLRRDLSSLRIEWVVILKMRWHVHLSTAHAMLWDSKSEKRDRCPIFSSLLTFYVLTRGPIQRGDP